MLGLQTLRSDDQSATRVDKRIFMLPICSRQAAEQEVSRVCCAAEFQVSFNSDRLCDALVGIRSLAEWRCSRAVAVLLGLLMF